MEPAVHALQMVPGNVGINLSGRDVGMAEQFLHDAQIRSPLQQVGREGMSERMGRNRFGDTGFFRVFFDLLPNELTRQSAPPSAGEEMIGFRLQFGTYFLQILGTGMNRLPADRNNPLLVPFPAAADEPAFEVEILQSQTDNFGYPHPRRVKTLQQSPIADTGPEFGVRCAQDRFDFAGVQKLRKPLPKFRRFEHARHIFAQIPFADKKPVKELDGHEPAGDRGRLLPPLFFTHHKIEDMVAFDLRPIPDFLLMDETVVGRKVLRIGLERIFGKPFLHGKVV